MAFTESPLSVPVSAASLAASGWKRVRRCQRLILMKRGTRSNDRRFHKESI